MFDWDELSKKWAGKIEKKLDFKNNEYLPDWYKKGFKYFYYKVLPVSMGLTQVILTFWIMFKIYDKAGFERVMIVLLILILLVLRSVSSKLGKFLKSTEKKTKKKAKKKK